MAELDTYLSVLFKFLAASLIIERLLEFLDRLFAVFGFAAGNKKVIIRLSNKQLSPDQEARRRLKKMLIIQTVGFIAGIAVSYFSKLGIAKMLAIVPGDTLHWWDILLSGILISGGTEPIHNLINFLKQSKEKASAERADLQAKQDTIDLAEETGIIGIHYNGGLYPQKAGHGLRKKNPRYIVLHHSGTSEKATFEEIVNLEKQERTNARGRFKLDPSYHAVITYDGTCHNYCRWDSIGWHIARGSRVTNGNSLGLCITGNFENRKEVDSHNTWDNNPKPSEEQIETAARLLALWRLLYNIEESGIILHRNIKRKQTNCPGNIFPTDRLVAKSSQLVRQWQQDPLASRELATFKEKAYVFVSSEEKK